jgi:hypothetical protein
VELAFFRWLLEHRRKRPQRRGRELAYLDELAHHAAEGATALVPRVPAVVPQLLHTLRDPRGRRACWRASSPRIPCSSRAC